MTGPDRRVRGRPALWWYDLYSVVLVVFSLLFVLGFAAWIIFDLGALGFLVILVTFGVAWGATLLRTRVPNERAETRAGYTTLYGRHPSLEQVDPATGHVIRAAGARALARRFRPGEPTTGRRPKHWRRRWLLIALPALGTMGILYIVYSGGLGRLPGGLALLFVVMIPSTLLVLFGLPLLIEAVVRRRLRRRFPHALIALVRGTTDLRASIATLGNTAPPTTVPWFSLVIGPTVELFYAATTNAALAFSRSSITATERDISADEWGVESPAVLVTIQSGTQSVVVPFALWHGFLPVPERRVDEMLAALRSR